MCRLSAEDLPVFRSATTSKAIFCPSLRPRKPAAGLGSRVFPVERAEQRPATLGWLHTLRAKIEKPHTYCIFQIHNDLEMAG